MHALLHHPAILAALIPFLVALLTAEVLLRLRLSGLALVAAFAATVFISADFSVTLDNIQHQIIWLVLGGALLGLLFGLLDFSWLRALLTVFGVAALIAILLPTLQTHALQSALLWGAASAVFMAFLVWCMDALHNQPLRAANAASALGIALGMALLTSASSSLGQFALAAGCGAVAHLFIQMVSNKPLAANRVLTFPAAFLGGAVASIAVLSHHLPWYALPLLAAIPLAAWIMPLPKASALLQSLLLSIVTFGLAAGVLYFSGFHLS
jgi:hypothetical protein